eukprot:6119869-Prorocentrum_lima.AAC.1
MTKIHVPLSEEKIQKTTLEGTASLEKHYKQGHVTKRKDCPVWLIMAHKMQRGTQGMLIPR